MLLYLSLSLQTPSRRLLLCVFMRILCQVNGTFYRRFSSHRQPPAVLINPIPQFTQIHPRWSGSWKQNFHIPYFHININPIPQFTQIHHLWSGSWTQNFHIPYFHININPIPQFTQTHHLWSGSWTQNFHIFHIFITTSTLSHNSLKLTTCGQGHEHKTFIFSIFS